MPSVTYCFFFFFTFFSTTAFFSLFLNRNSTGSCLHKHMHHTYVFTWIFPQEFAIQVYLCSVPLINELVWSDGPTATIDSVSGASLRLSFLKISALIARFFGHTYWKNSHQLHFHRLACGTYFQEEPFK